LASGKVLWSKDFSKDYGASPPTWGFAGSPLVKGDLLITEVGGSGSSVIAFDKATGKEAWRAGDDAVSYSSIVPLVVGGQESLAVFSAKGVVGRSPKDGAEQWRYAWKTSYDVHAATPVVSGDKVFISSGYGSGCALVQVQVGAGEPKELWRNKSMRNHVCSCVLWEGHLYGFDEGQLKCLDFQTGEEKWGEKSYGKGSITLGGDKFIVYSDKGRVGVVEPSPAGFKELTSFQVLTGKDTWAVPVLANGKLYCRSQEALVCLDLAAP
jgi:outer membrane protein assembly factor BamB